MWHRTLSTSVGPFPVGVEAVEIATGDDDDSVVG
jgi:hypothetical protein